MKIVLLGGSSPSTPELFRCLAGCPPMPPLKFCLVGRSREHLNRVLRAVHIISAEIPFMLEASSFEPSELTSALRGADLVLIQIRCGGYQGRHFDETFPLRYGLCGDEGLGPGGLSAAWRGWPTMNYILSTIASVCPQTSVVMLSSPVTLFVRAARRLYPALNTFGICELPWTTLQDFATNLDAEASDIDFDYFGVNHLGWFCRLEYNSRDLLEEYKARLSLNAKWPSPELVSSCRAFPTKYLRLHYERQEVFREQRLSRISRAQILARTSSELYSAFHSGNKSEILEALEQRPAPWYQHAVVLLLLAFSRTDIGIPLFLTSPNGTYGSGFRPDDVLEIPTYISAGKFVPRPCRQPPSSHVLQTMSSFMVYERTATEALIQQCAALASNALEMHPWVESRQLAAALAAEIAAQPEHH